MNKQEIINVFQMPREQYEAEFMKPAYETMLAHKRGVTAVAMLGYSNVCKNQCLYCGMRAGNTQLNRYRLQPDAILELARAAYDTGLRRVFLVSGEDPKYDFDALLNVVAELKKLGFLRISMGSGEFSRQQFEELKSAGLDEYAMKFEMSHKETFERLNPSTSFEKRGQTMQWIKEAGLNLASGNIVDYPGQTLEELADDILLMQELQISWAPNIPYMPAVGTPLAAEGGPGRLDRMHREISLLRLLLPNVDITAQQPGSDLKNGLGDPQGNQWAIQAGGNILFVDMLPAAQAADFRVVDNRLLQGVNQIRRIVEETGTELLFE